MNKTEEWRKIILSINDNSFFDLMRNYLGKIETPFNKQDLINRLINFFNNEQTKEKILSMIDIDDASLLTAVSIIQGPTDHQLQNVFHEWSYLDLHNKIHNLEERFLLYRKGRAYYITPIFEDLFQEKIISPSLLINTRESQEDSDSVPWLTDPLMMALLSFIQKNKSLIKIDGSIKKRGITELERVFPTLFSGEEGLKRFEICTSVLSNLNLVESYDGLIYINRAQWDRLSEESEIRRYCLYYGAAMAQNSNTAHEFASFFTSIYNNFPENKAIHKDSLNRYYTLYCEQSRQKKASYQLNHLSEILININILIEENDYIRINSLLDLFHNEQHSEPPLVIQPNFEITVKPFISLTDSLVLANAIEIRQYDLFSRYILNRESFLRAFDKGIKSDVLLEKLRELSGKEIPQNVIISLQDWEEDHRKVTLYSGIVLKVSSDKQILIDNTDYLKPYIKEVLAPGVYLLGREQEKQWMEALRELSISPLPAGDLLNQNSTTENVSVNIPFFDAELVAKRKNWVEKKDSNEPSIYNHIDCLLKNLNSSGIQGDEKKEITARIKRRLIILESQINRGIIRPEITEAKGMNFQGKVRLIESALLNRSDKLELNYYTPDGIQSILVQPIELLKEDKERTLIGKILPDEENINIKGRKISKVKKIRSSLF